MRFALLGADRESFSLARAACDQGHTPVWPPSLVDGGLTEEVANELSEALDWEQLLDREGVDAVLMGAGERDVNLRARQLGEMLRAGQSVLAVHPLFAQVLAYYEMDMLRIEHHALLRHYNPLTNGEAFDDARPLIGARWTKVGAKEGSATAAADVGLGKVEQVAAIRFAADRSSGNVAWHFARDVELLEQLAGRCHRIGAHGGVGDGAYAGLSVQLMGTSGHPIRWSVAPPMTGSAAQGPGLEIVIVCTLGRVELVYDERGVLRSARSLADAQETSLVVAKEAPEVQAVGAFFSEVHARRSAHGAEASCEKSSWPIALHAMDLTDSIEISLRRGRMIDVHDQTLTEELAFKGTMAAAGCGLLLVGPPLMLLAGWLAGLVGVSAADYWPHALLALMTLFLAIQFAARLLLGKGSLVEGSKSAMLG